MTSRMNVSGARIDGSILEEKVRLGQLKQAFLTTVTTFTIDDDSPPLLFLTPTVAMTVTLPPFAKGARFIIRNMATATFTLTVVDSLATAVTTISATKGAYVVSDGASWSAVVPG